LKDLLYVAIHVILDAEKSPTRRGRPAVLLPHNASCWAAEIPFLSLTMHAVSSARGAEVRHPRVSINFGQLIAIELGGAAIRDLLCAFQFVSARGGRV
jgi:hypothetical protein